PTSLVLPHLSLLFFFSFYDTAPTEIYTLSLHDALPISERTTFYTIVGVLKDFHYESLHQQIRPLAVFLNNGQTAYLPVRLHPQRSEEHTSELQSRENLVCRLLLEKKKKKTNKHD